MNEICEQEIRAKAKTSRELCDRLASYQKSTCYKKYCSDCDENSWVSVDDVLEVLRQHRTEHTKKLQTFLVWLKSWTDDGIIIAKFEELLKEP
jgi:hypothetical protein